MQRDDLNDLHAFSAIAEDGNFTRAAARLGMSQSALSHALRRLETRLDIRLLTRTTRNVAPTEAGSRLLGQLTPALEMIEEGLRSIGDLRKTPSGTIRITASEHACDTVLWPAVKEWLPHYPEVIVEISLDSRMTDIVGDRFDAGIRIGESVDKDMIAVRIGPDLRLIVVASPDYLDRAGTPESPHDLADHRAVNLRMRSGGGIYVWELERDGHGVRVPMEGALIFDDSQMVLEGAIAGFGLAMAMEDVAAPYLTNGALKQVLTEWTQPFAGYFLYYPSRRQHSAAFSLLLDRLRERGRI
ncbi:LysR family transcriptional regulator [Sphingobium sp. V4]|uniref:LysR family transcriptional regulator n=1 Tax=Sphingobium sp. V4 TaxID=3038927 RepID=UPI0025580ED4|nr:LysR family transcriptional regulator [Sphingobium sp. V4]WIW89940.1 LysR family transcriptional regulator [Sphingobium sp. V4]